MITVTATQRVKQGKEAEVESLMKGLTDEIIAREQGCRRFEHLRAEEDPRRYIVIEQYADEAAFEHHKGTPYLQAFIPKLLELLEEPPTVTVYRDVESETPLRRVPDTATYFHVGVVVRDLKQATRRYSEILGVTFTEPATFHVPEVAGHPYQVVAAFSRQGPPYYELIQAAHDNSVFCERNADQILYVGVWDSDIPTRVEALKRQGVSFEALLEDSQGVPFVCLTKPDALEGMRIEFVGDGARAGIEQWVRTGVWTGEVAD